MKGFTQAQQVIINKESQLELWSFYSASRIGSKVRWECANHTEGALEVGASLEQRVKCVHILLNISRGWLTSAYKFQAIS